MPGALQLKAAWSNGVAIQSNPCLCRACTGSLIERTKDLEELISVREKVNQKLKEADAAEAAVEAVKEVRVSRAKAIGCLVQLQCH